MRVVRQNEITWFLDDEGLVETVRGLTEQQDGRRAYNAVSHGNRRIFAKYFFEKGIYGFVRNHIDPRGRREFRTGKALLSFDIATPQPLGYGLGRRGSFALQEWIDAQPLWSPIADPIRRPVLLEGLARLLLKLREHRVTHNDLHLGNILAKDGQLFLVDLHKAKIGKMYFTRSDEVKNLCHVLGHFYQDLTTDERQSFFEIYGSTEVRGAVEKGIVEQEIRWVDRKKARAFCTTSKLIRIGRRVHVKGAEKTGQGAFVECIKNDRKVRVDRHSDHIRKIYRNSRRLAKAWGNHVVLEYMDLPVVPRGLYVQRAAFLRRGFIAMEDLQGKGEELDRFLDRQYDAMNEHQVRDFADAFSRFLGELLRKGILHRDMKACNVFVLENGFRLLDVEDLIFSRFKDGDIIRTLIQLTTSVPGRITFSHRAYFFFKIAKRLGLRRSEKKRVFTEATKASTREPIIYEGVNGLRKESWAETPT